MAAKKDTTIKVGAAATIKKAIKARTALDSKRAAVAKGNAKLAKQLQAGSSKARPRPARAKDGDPRVNELLNALDVSGAVDRAAVKKSVEPTPAVSNRLPRCRLSNHSTSTAIEYNRDAKRSFMVVMDQPIDVVSVPLDKADADWGDLHQPAGDAAATYLFSHTPKTQRAFDQLKEIFMQDLSNMSQAELTKLYNKHAKRPVKTFPSVEAAKRACELLLESAVSEDTATTTTTADASAAVDTNTKASKSTTKQSSKGEATMATAKKTSSKKTTSKKAAPAKKTSKTDGAAKAGAKVKPKVVGAKKGGDKKPGTGSKIKELILAGKDTDEKIVEKVLKEFGGSTTVKNVAWYRSQLRKELGANKVPAPVKAKA